jgi:inner membrane protein
MPTIFTHPLVPVAITVSLGNRIIPPRLLWAGMILSILPDLDVILLQMGVSWYSVYGHRGFTHSIGFALICGLLLAMYFRQRSPQALIFGAAVVLSHALLDAITWGGQGVALYWPINNDRFLFSYHPLPASPLDLLHFIRWSGFILRAEFRIVWMPLIGFTLVAWAIRKLLIPTLLHSK